MSKIPIGSLALLTWSFSHLQWRPPKSWIDLVVTEVCEREHELQGHEFATFWFGWVLLVLG